MKKISGNRKYLRTIIGNLPLKKIDQLVSQKLFKKLIVTSTPINITPLIAKPTTKQIELALKQKHNCLVKNGANKCTKKS